MTTSVPDAVAEFAHRHCLSALPGRLHVGFSGGADSTALVLALNRLDIPFVAVHFEHGLRGTAGQADCDWCRTFCEQRGIPFRQQTLHVPERRRSREGVEAAARRCRLEAWRELCGENDAVALGHHRDDELETFFLRVMRGAGVDALVGLREDRVIQGLRFVRPLLRLRRAQLVEFLRSVGVTDWREDASNRDTALRRNAVRHELLPAIRRIAGTDEGVERCCDALAVDADFLARAAESADADTQWDRARLAALHPALRGRVLRRRIQASRGIDLPLSAETRTRLNRELEIAPDHEKIIPLGQGVVLRLECDGTFAIAEADEHAAVVPTREWPWRESPLLTLPEVGVALRAEPIASADNGCAAFDNQARSEVFDAGELPKTLTVRAWQSGDRMVPFGATKSVKVQDVLTNARVPRHRRACVPVVCAGARILWLAGVRRAEFGRVRPGAERVRLSLEPL